MTQEPFVTRYEVGLMIDTIKEMIEGQRLHFDTRFDSNDKAVREAKEASEKAVSTAREGVLKHDEATNEFRKQIGEERADYARKPEVAFQISALEARLDVIEKKANIAVGKDQWLLGVVLTLAIFAANLAAKYILG